MDERPRAKNPEDREAAQRARAAGAAGARAGAGAGAADRSGRGGELRELGSVIGNRYVLKRHLGAGRYGEIYEAVDRTLSDPQLRVDQTVALHLLHPHVAKHTRLLQKLETSYHAPHLWAHPNVLKLAGFGVDGGRYFLVSELLDGATLRSLLDSVPPERRADADKLAVLRGVGDALKYAHGNGVVHGDVRPEKIFVTTEGVVKVLDLLPASSPRTRPYFVEDSDPKTPAALDKRDDVYGLAAVAYELWQGQLPFDGLTPIESARSRAMLTPIANLPTHQWDALARALRLRREHRTADIAEFLANFGVTGGATLRTAAETKNVEPEPRYPRDDDMPIIGDYSHRVLDVAAMEQSLQAAVAPAQPAPAAAAPVAPRDPDSLRVDPRDMHRYAKRARRADGKPLVTAITWLVVALLIAGAGVAVYLNIEPLRARADQWLAAIRGSDAVTSVISPSGLSGEEVVEAPVVVEARDIPPEPAASPPPAAAPRETPPRAAASTEPVLPRPVNVLPPTPAPANDAPASAASETPAPAAPAPQPEVAANLPPPEPFVVSPEAAPPLATPAVEPQAAEPTPAPVADSPFAAEAAPPPAAEPAAAEAAVPAPPLPDPAPAVAGVAVPTVDPAQAAAAPAPATEPPAAAPAPATESPAAVADAAPTPEVAAPAPVPAPAPAPPRPLPPEPESFEVSVRSLTVSEREAGARITVRRRGGSLRESSVVWWTEDGTAIAGNDYADLGRITERFAAGEASRTIYVPIIGDAAREATETFYVNLDLNTPDSERLEPIARVEVSVTDDD